MRDLLQKNSVDITALGLASKPQFQMKIDLAMDYKRKPSAMHNIGNFMQSMIHKEMQKLDDDPNADVDEAVDVITWRKTSTFLSKNLEDLDAENKRQTRLQRTCGRIPPRFIVSFKHPYRQIWEWIPMLLSIYNGITIPLEFSYAISYGYLAWHENINIVLDLLFLLDNALMFFTSFENRYGDEIKDPYEILMHYTSTRRFVFDSLSLLGNSFFVQMHPWLKYFHLFKATRVFRVSEKIKKSDQPISVKGILKVFSLVFYLFLYLHWLDCWWCLWVSKSSAITYIVQKNGSYESQFGEVLTGQDGSPVPYQGKDFIVAQIQTFASTDWRRYTAEDGVLGWQKYNERWDSRSSEWVAPVNFVNPADSRLHTEEYSMQFRYLTYFYYA